MKTYATLLVVAGALTACDKPDIANTTRTTGATVPADNTGRNTRDMSGAITPIDQGNGREDLETTQAIRKAVMADEALSIDAKNVKIMTNEGVITLRGPVRSVEERRSVESKALAAAGKNRIDSQLEIAP